MSIIQDGSHKFGILNPTLTGALQTEGYVIESFTRNLTTNRVDLNNGDGIELGAKVVPQREEASFTIQAGTNTALPEVGDVVTADGGSTYYLLTEVSTNETQEDFVRLNLSGFKTTNGVRPVFLKLATSSEQYRSTGKATTYTRDTLNLTSQVSTTITSTSAFNVMVGYVLNSDATTTYQLQITPSTGTYQSGDSSANSGVTLVAGGNYIRFSMSSTVTKAELNLKYST